MTSAGEILVLDSDGTLTIHNELDDKPACDDLTQAQNEQAAGGAAGLGVTPGMGPGGGLRGLDMLERPEAPTRGRPPRAR